MQDAKMQKLHFAFYILHLASCITMKTIRASEVGEYVYCARAWWLRRVVGEEPAGQARRDLGTLRHARHSRAVALSGVLIWLAAALLAAGLAILLISSQQ
jgi:CRISPR/Cas system-associated exonuclease Cas4 (RecB family)